MDFLHSIFSLYLYIYRKVAYGLGWFCPSIMKRLCRWQLESRGVFFHGQNPWDIEVKNEKFYTRAVVDFTLGVGESYMEGWIDIKDIPEFFYRLTRDNFLKDCNPLRSFAYNLMYKTVNLQTKIKSKEVAEKHYDLGNSLYEKMLDPTMNYTCAYWRIADNLNDAQIAKMDLVAKKLMLKPGMRVLDLGCGYGSLAKYLAENYKVQMVGVNISTEQVKWGRNKCKHLPNVEFVLSDYRDIKGKFDRVVSVGLMEHVGVKNYKEFFTLVHSWLVDDGIFLVHSIGQAHKGVIKTDPWVDKYIFPNGMLPYHLEMSNAFDGLFIMEDWQNFSHDYSRTLLAWHRNFIAGWPQLKGQNGFDDKFFKMWNYYLLSAAGVFKARKFQLWQVVLSKNGLTGGYHSPR